MARAPKDSAVDRKLRAVEDELNALKKGMKSLSKEMGKRRIQEDDLLDSPPEAVPPKEEFEIPAARPPVPLAAPITQPEDPVLRPRTGRPVAATPDRIHEGRFADYYVANSYRSSRPLRRELNVQRARALFMLVFAVLLLTWFTYMYGPAIAGLFSHAGTPATP